MVGETVSHYRILEELGGGAMGVVYRAEDTRLGRDVALKFLPPELTDDAESRDRFRIEARAASALDHPNICTIYDVDETEDGRLFIVMAFYDGETLKARLARGPLSVEDALEIARQIALGLERAHEREIVHRDIKSANLLVTSRGEPKIVDFGVARLLSEEGMTSTGMSIGTLAYMAPEQVDGKGVGTAADVWALGVVLYEMLTGDVPFTGPTAELVAGIVGRDPGAPQTRRGDVPEAASALVLGMLAKDQGQRPSAGEVARLLSDILRPSAAAQVPLARRPTTWIALAATVLVLAVAVVVPAQRRALADAARTSLLDIEGLVAEERFREAYDLAVEAERVLGDDPAVAAAMLEASDVLTVRSDPPDAEVRAIRFDPRAPDGVGEGESVFLGTTPIENMRLARGDLLLTIERQGSAPIERIASSRFDRDQRVYQLDPQIVVETTLIPLDDQDEGVVPVPGGPYVLVSADAPSGPQRVAMLTDFLMDRFEVTNAEYREFIRAGGYDSPGLDAFRDRTGLPGPREWTGQEFPPGADRLPVSSVSWHEADAFCAWRGGSLPTLYEWEKAARDGSIARQEGFALPWGVVRAGQSTDPRANFGGTGPVAVDAHPFGISAYGVYAMAGNVREWTLNEAEGGRIAMGGSWQDPAYVFSSIATRDAAFASPGLGFRCVRRAAATEPPGAGQLELVREAPSYEPVDEATYRAFLDFYRYDPVPSNVEILETVETEDWSRLKIEYDGPDGSRIPAYLHLPRAATPPYQTMVFVPGLTAFFAGQLHEATEWLLGPNIRAGRAVLSVVLEGMVERPLPSGFPSSRSVEFRNLMVRHATELRLGLDYLETRDDIDMDRLAYIGQSFGAGSRSVFAAVDDRWRAVIFVGAGIDERLQPTVPEALNVNFLPYVTVPKLVINGRQDEEHPWLTRGLPFWELLTEPRELVLDEDEGHIPSLEVRTPAINDFLDRQFGPVR